MKTKILALLVAALLFPACRSLGSQQADAGRASDVGSTAGGVIGTIPGTEVATVPISVLTGLAEREAARRIAATPEGEPLGLWTQLLIGLGALGAAFTAAKTGLRVATGGGTTPAPKPPAT